LHCKRPLASQGGCNIAVAYIHWALAHSPRLGRRVGQRLPDIAAQSACAESTRRPTYRPLSCPLP
jgi:hypothetical protein